MLENIVHQLLFGSALPFSASFITENASQQSFSYRVSSEFICTLLCLFFFYMLNAKEPENPLQELVSEEETMDSLVDWPDPSESDIRGI